MRKDAVILCMWGKILKDPHIGHVTNKSMNALQSFCCSQLPGLSHSAMSVDGLWTAMLRIKMREKWQLGSQVRIIVVKMIVREEFYCNVIYGGWVNFPSISIRYYHSIPGSIHKWTWWKACHASQPYRLLSADLLETWRRPPISAHPGSSTEANEYDPQITAFSFTPQLATLQEKILIPGANFKKPT